MRSVGWKIHDDQFKHYLRQLRFKFHKWDTFACGELKIVPESIVLTPEEHQTIVSMAERLAKILRQIETQIRLSSRLLARLGIPAEVIPLIQAESESPLQLARYDFFPTPTGGWAVSEFNEDVPGGFNEIISAPQLLPEFHPGLTFADRFPEEFLAALPDQGTIALIYATGYSEDLQHMLILQNLLQQRQQPSILCSPRHMKYRWGNGQVEGKTVNGFVRFYPGEWFRMLENRKDWLRALGKLPMLNPLTRLISQSKGIFSIWEQEGMVSPDDLAFLHSVAPRTYTMVDALQNAELIKQVQAEPDRWVLKENFGRMGENVVMGSLCQPGEWQMSLEEGVKRPVDFIVQEKFDVTPMSFQHGLRYPGIGAFLINGRFAGYYSRIAHEPFLTHSATYVPTVIDVP